jgi:transposase
MTNSEQRRLTNWRLKLLQAAGEAGNVARTCRHFAISRKTFYKWRQRYHEHGDPGLADRARAPHRSPRATPADVVSKILYLRQHYHFGLGKIADYLKRFHGVSVACASVHRILRKHGMNRLPANQKYRRHAHRWTRYEKAQPGHRLQVDVKFLERIPGLMAKPNAATWIKAVPRDGARRMHVADVVTCVFPPPLPSSANPPARRPSRSQACVPVGGSRSPRQDTLDK